MLTEEQIQSLFTFCEKHFVKYYDVQVELVDHLANAIELEMQHNSKLTFEKAVEKVHQSFGVIGFAPLVAEKQATAEKQSRKLFWKLLKAQFGLPKILTFFVLSAILFNIFSFDESLILAVSVVTVFICWPIFFIGILRLQQGVSKTGKKFLSINFSWISALILVPFYMLNISNVFRVFMFNNQSIFAYTPPHILIPAVSIFLSLYIMAIIAIWQTFISIKRNLIKTYPEAFSPSE